ncbi:metallophosphoesterase family protein [Arenibacter certesii]|uniref:Metallophosphatase n=1 Tax=Arenibacter certesii TaxID=228955 RepID=A0A918IQ94_9FLAO|nr:metallophosphoesterase family protein [Arenibacter certesii]GGW25033.1 metallophosphatase [Arenibacter certesii]
MRTLVIGDVHAGLRALEQVLERAKIGPKDHLIFLGDYVDGWSQAVETIDFLLDLQNRQQCTFIRGNHDALCYEWLKSGDHNELWLQHGGSVTQNSYKLVTDKVKEAHMVFYDNLKDYYIDNGNRLFIHAGFTNLKGVEQEYDSKTFYWDRTLWELALAIDPTLDHKDDFFPKRLTHYKEIFIGHTPVTRIGTTRPKKAVNIWNVDTGAAFKGPLTMMDIASKEYWQSDPVHLLYPTENGRN